MSMPPWFPWFPFAKFQYRPTFDLAELPRLRMIALSTNLPSVVVYQIDYYFSEDNLAKDFYFRSHMDNQGWVDIFVIAEFQRIQHMTNDIEFLLCSMRLSTNVEVKGYKLRKRHGWEKWIVAKKTPYIIQE